MGQKNWRRKLEMKGPSFCRLVRRQQGKSQLFQVTKLIKIGILDCICTYVFYYYFKKLLISEKHTKGFVLWQSYLRYIKSDLPQQCFTSFSAKKHFFCKLVNLCGWSGMHAPMCSWHQNINSLIVEKKLSLLKQFASKWVSCHDRHLLLGSFQTVWITTHQVTEIIRAWQLKALMISFQF